MPDPQTIGTAWIYDRVLKYCEDRANGIKSYYRQHSYKENFLRILCDALLGGFTGSVARSRYQKRQQQLKRKRVSAQDYTVTGHSIREYLERRWLHDNNTEGNRVMVEDLCLWWDEWLFAIVHSPPECSVPRHRKRIKRMIGEWRQECETRRQSLEGRKDVQLEIRPKAKTTRAQSGIDRPAV
jgi:hypothetical protein